MFCEELRTVERARLTAVASRDHQRAAAFREEFGFDTAYGSYDEIFADPAVDIVYIVVPHAFHAELVERAMRAGKAVVCEKPLTPSQSETERLVKISQECGVFLMEALKTGFLPAIQQAVLWVKEKAIGDPRILRADFCFVGSQDPNDRLLNPQLAGGSVLDVGIYPLSLARILLGEITDLKATGRLAATGVDQSAAISTRHADHGAIASLTCSIHASYSLDAVVLGTKGKILLPHSPRATEATLVPDDGESITFQSPDETRVVAEIVAAMNAMDQGLLECPGHTHSDSIALAAAMDQAIAQIADQ